MTQCTAAEILPTVSPKRRWITGNAASRHVRDWSDLRSRYWQNMTLAVTLQVLRQKQVKKGKPWHTSVLLQKKRWEKDDREIEINQTYRENFNITKFLSKARILYTEHCRLVLITFLSTQLSRDMPVAVGRPCEKNHHALWRAIRGSHYSSNNDRIRNKRLHIIYSVKSITTVRHLGYNRSGHVQLDFLWG